ncbi:MAG: penicillin-binding protein 2 [Tissierellia bacterium]|nr:penicillin-binding protein 2 [Tissierellia bacterium]
MKTNDNRKILILLVFLILLLLSLIFYLSYFVIFQAPEIIDNPANRRARLEENSVKRGTIYDRNNEILAYSTGEKYKYKRNYNYPVIYSHVVGYSDRIVGKYGLEFQLNDYLLGRNTSKLLKSFKSYFNSDVQLDVGDNVTLTTDTNVQKKARNLLAEKYNKGAIVMMNPKTGEVYASVSLPDFNSQNIAADMSEILRQNNATFYNNVIKGKYPPGSVFKIVTTTALLESEVDQNYEDTGEEMIDGRPFTNSTDKVYGKVGLKTAFTHSLNTYFAKKATEIGKDKMVEVAEKYMINQDVDFQLPLKKSTWNYEKKDFDRTSLAAAGIGHDTIVTTPLEMCMVASTIANDGIMMKPNIVKSIDAPNGDNIVQINPSVLSEVTTKEIAEQIKELMINVVNNGTGTEAYVRGYQIAGKTGTAQRNIKEDINDAWFVGFAPADDPKVAIAVVIPDVNEYAGKVAAPIGGELLKYALDVIQFEE